MAQYKDLSIPNPEFSARWKPTPAFPTSSITELRHAFKTYVAGHFNEYWSARLPSEESYRTQVHEIPVEGGTVKARSVTPTGGDTCPLLVWFHSGGFVNGDIDMDDFYLRNVAVDLQISILNVDYRRAPEHKFPTSLNDSYTAVKWAANNADVLGTMLSAGFIVAGASAGGNIAVGIAHRALKDPFFSADRQITGQALQMPMAIHADAYPDEWKDELLSLEQNKDSPGLNKAVIMNLYNIIQAPPADPEFSVLLAAHEGISPAFIQVCGMDPLRDEGLLYEKVLRETGIKTRLGVYAGVPHNFYLSLCDIQAAVRFDKDFRDGVRWLLSNSV